MVDFINKIIYDGESIKKYMLEERKHESRSVFVKYVIGDLHGNAFKLIFFLYFVGFLKINESTLEQFRAAYNTYNYVNFSALLEKSMFHENRCKTNKLTIIGDTLSDRGNSDYMTLLVFDAMAKNSMDFIIIFSNHDLSFVDRHIFNKKPELLNFQCRSYDYKFILEETHRNNFNNIFLGSYLDHLAIIDCDFYTNKLMPIIYTHAPNDLEKINNFLAFVFNYTNVDIFYSDINTVNDSFRKLLSRSFKMKNLDENKYSKIYDFVWARDELKPSLKVKYVYGHTGQEGIKGNNEFRLDGGFGYTNPNNSNYTSDRWHDAITANNRGKWLAFYKENFPFLKLNLCELTSTRT